VGRKRTCELPFCKGIVEGTRNKRRCDNDRNIHLHQIISKNVKKIMKYIEGHETFTANDVNRDLFKGKLDKNEKGSMYRLFQAMVRENYIKVANDKKTGLNLYAFVGKSDKQEEPKVKSENIPRMSPEDLLLGKVREFVYSKSGQWSHDDWTWLSTREDVKVFGLSDADLGRVLEEEKSRYWLKRNG